MIAERCESERSIAKQFDVTSAAIHRHKGHVQEAITKAVRRSEAKTGDRLLSKWEERLDQAWSAARHGYERAGTDPEQWSHGAKFIMAAAKLIETGLRVDGIITGGEGKSTVINVDQVVVLPMGSQVPSPIRTIDVSPEQDSSSTESIESIT